MLRIAECLVDFQYENGNERFYCYVDIEWSKIKGNITKEMAIKAVEDYMTNNYNRVVLPETRRMTLNGEKVYSSTSEASMAIQKRLLTDYFAKY
jgi:hypothetical protein